MLEFGPQITINLLIIMVMSYAAICDVRTRSVPNTPWIILMLLGLVGVLTHPITITTFLFNILLVAGVGVIVYRFGIGGADMKAIIALGIAYPYMPIMPLMVIMIAESIAFAGMMLAGWKKTPFIACLLIGLIVALLAF